MLKIDLSSRSSSIEEIPGTILRKYLGGRGLGSYLLYHHVPAKADPLGQDNHILLTAGPLSGTAFPYTSKANLNTKSPLTGIYLYSVASGILAEQMVKAGLMAIDVQGISESPVYLVINNQTVEFRNATSLWGKETAAAQDAMLGNRPSAGAATLSIGPAGEQLVPYAAAFVGGSRYRCFGRGGAGCVMGSKKLKGMVIAGDGKIEVADKSSLDASRKKVLERLRTTCKSWADVWRRYETAADLEATNEFGIIPTRNWQNGQFEGWRGIDKSTTPIGWPEKSRACAPHCPTPGICDVVIKEGPYQGAHSDVEWEAVYAFGSACGVDRMDAIIAASQICDEFGVDNMTAGITIAFAMECFEKGLIGLGDTDGIELRFGDHLAMIAALKKMVRQEGFGKRLACGTRKLSEQIKGSEGFAMHAKGMEFGGYECRGLNGQALQFAIGARGGCHHSYGLPARTEIGDGTRLNINGKGEQVKQAAIGRILHDSLIFCTFPMQVPCFTKDLMAETISSALGETYSVDDLDKIGERIMCQERLFNMREGLTRKDDTLPQRLLREPKPDGPTKGVVVPLEQLKDDFYRVMGYDPATGNPTDAILKKLGIER